MYQEVRSHTACRVNDSLVPRPIEEKFVPLAPGYEAKLMTDTLSMTVERQTHGQRPRPRNALCDRE